MSTRIHDTTLRDGEQTPGVAFTDAEKIAIVRLLDELGAAEIECGIPAMGDDESRLVKRIVDLETRSRILTWNRAVRSDIKASIDAGVSAVAVSLPVSDPHIHHKLGKTRDWVLNRLSEITDYAKERNLYVCVGAEDASRADPEFLGAFAARAELHGADRIRYADTVGCLDPFGVYEAITRLKSQVKIPIEIHAHNDFGMATANSLAAVRAGADSVSVTALGLGERAGNAAIEEVVYGLMQVMGLEIRIRLSMLPKLCSYVAHAASRPIHPHKPIVGSAIFAHESEIHVGAVLDEPALYEPFDPGPLAHSREIALGKYSGKRAVAYRLRELGEYPSLAEIRVVIRMIRRMSNCVKRSITDRELLAVFRRASATGEDDAPANMEIQSAACVVSTGA
jgi:homocitrate synthase NifV